MQSRRLAAALAALASALTPSLINAGFFDVVKKVVVVPVAPVAAIAKAVGAPTPVAAAIDPLGTAPAATAHQVVANPGRAVEIAANPTGASLGFAAQHAGVNPDLVNPVPKLVRQAPDGVKEAIAAQIMMRKAELGVAKALLSRDGCDKAAVDWLAAQTKQAYGPGLVQAAQPAVGVVAPGPMRNLYMEKPQIDYTAAPDGAGGEPVYYVNGMDTTREQARREATELARHLGRPVKLIYSETHGVPRDLALAAYELSWPLQPPPRPQADSTTRQLTYLLYHADAKVSVVTHSRGCLQMRNALLTAASFKGDDLAQNVAWVATGVPLRDEEIWSTPIKFKALANAGDQTAQWVGRRLTADRFPNGKFYDHHDFIDDYVSQISASDLWP